MKRHLALFFSFSPSPRTVRTYGLFKGRPTAERATRAFVPSHGCKLSRETMALSILLLAVSLPSSALAAVTVIPLAPTTADAITIQAANQLGGESIVTSAFISRVGNTFVIQQNLQELCTTPSGHAAVSQFQVGPLASGVYNVIATINFTEAPGFPCPQRPPITQTSAFAVGTAIPTLHPWLMALLACVLAVSAVATLAPTSP